MRVFATLLVIVGARAFHLSPFATRTRSLCGRGRAVDSSRIRECDVVLVPRSVARLKCPARLPVWPAWNGILFIILDLLKQRGLAARLEEKLGGRVCPMQLEDDADPFILLVHHRHSFQKFDPLRAAFRMLLPEGFPAHPHRGFETVTYVLPGRRGLVHRDSLGVKMRYNNGQAQWMTAGRGVLHEEMWETDMNGDNYDDDDDGGDKEGSGRILGGLSSDAELYQLWLNLPPERKLCEPRIQLVTPTADDNVNTRPPPPQVPAGAAPIQVVDLLTILVQGGSTRSGGSSGDGSGRVGSAGGGITRVRVLSGSGVHGVDSGTEAASPVTILHSTVGPGSTWALSLPPAFTAILYVRSGEVAVGADGEGTSPGGGSSSSSRGVATVVGVHELAHLTKGGDGIVLRNANQAEEADVMVFAGLPLGAPVVASGTMVMNSEAEVARALEDYQRGDFGLPWDHEIPDDSWRAGVSAWKKRGA